MGPRAAAPVCAGVPCCASVLTSGMLPRDTAGDDGVAFSALAAAGGSGWTAAVGAGHAAWAGVVRCVSCAAAAPAFPAMSDTGTLA